MTPLKARLAEVAINVVLLFAVSLAVLGRLMPAAGGKLMWLTGTIAMMVFFNLSAPFFVRPRVALAAAITAAFGLYALDLTHVQQLPCAFEAVRTGAVWFDIIVVVAALVAIALYEPPATSHKLIRWLSRTAFILSHVLGRGRLIFMPPILISILGFYQDDVATQMWLMLGATAVIYLNPGELVLRLRSEAKALSKDAPYSEMLGEIRRIDDPGLIRVALTSASEWKRDRVHVALLADGTQLEVIPLFHQVQDRELIGTGLCNAELKQPLEGVTAPGVYLGVQTRGASEVIKELSGGDDATTLVGFVVEDSTISRLRFEVAGGELLEEGMLVFVRSGPQTVYYQILEARTAEESFSQNPRGTHVVTAGQLGILDDEQGFIAYRWVPAMNSAVFSASGLKLTWRAAAKDEFELGVIPGSAVPVRIRFRDVLDYHAAVLGVTGTGKTELALDLVRKALELGSKVICVDFTGEYTRRLAEFNPKGLSLKPSIMTQLSEKLQGVETGKYGASDEKKALQEFAKFTDMFRIRFQLS